jgi:phage shock protein PspC (stress-responsive transcriptional regulator)
LNDLEQAIAERCLRVLGRGKTVISAAEVDQILREVGPVDSGPSRGEAEAREPRPRTGAEPPAKRLYQIREGAMISGVCNGLAAYFNIDAAFVRVAFLFLALFLHGLGVALYVLLMILVPYAKTSEELAAAQGGSAGLPYRVQRLVENFKRKFMDKPFWKGSAASSSNVSH